MKEALNIPPDDFFSSLYNSSEEQEENNFNSPEANPENIFSHINKENSEQLSSKILCFPFTLDSYQLINIKSKEDPELNGTHLLVILGSLEKIKPNDKILKLIFSSKDKKSLLNLRFYQKEMNSLFNIGLDFIGLVQNVLFVKYENDNATNEAYISLQNSSILFDLLYEEEKQFNCSEDNFDKKSIKKIEDKKEEKNPINNITQETILNNQTKNISNKKVSTYQENSNLNKNVKKNLFPQINKNVKEHQQNQKQNNHIIFPPQIYSNNIFQNNNFQKMPQFNPLSAGQILNTNPLYLQIAMAFQNYVRLQQQMQVNNKINKEIKDQFNNIKNYSDFMNIINNNNNKINFNNNSSINKNNNLSPIHQKESLKNSNSTSASSKDSSPTMNYQSKINNIMNNNFKNIKIGMNNGNAANESNNLEEIIQNKKYKEYFPKSIKEKENDVQFQTNSTRDYQYKYVSRYIVQIENEKNFPVTKMIIGNNGMLLRKILLDNCIKYGDLTTKIRLRGKGSGYKEGINNEESKDPMELCISSLNALSFSRCSLAIENLLLQIYYQYYLYQCKNFNNKMGNSPITMKKILKYHYVVNRFNTLIKEEKRKMKEEKLNKINQIKEKNYDIKNSNFFP